MVDNDFTQLNEVTITALADVVLHIEGEHHSSADVGARLYDLIRLRGDETTTRKLDWIEFTAIPPKEPNDEGCALQSFRLEGEMLSAFDAACRQAIGFVKARRKFYDDELKAVTWEYRGDHVIECVTAERGEKKGVGLMRLPRDGTLLPARLCFAANHALANLIEARKQRVVV